ADFRGDGAAGGAFVGTCGLGVLHGRDGTPMWTGASTDRSAGSTGSSVFDFDGDLRAEVVYADETRLRIFDGATGTVEYETCNTSFTAFEYPVIADVDADDHAEIVVASNYAVHYSDDC